MREVKELGVVVAEVALLRKLVREELDRRCAAIDDIILQAYQVVPAKHTEEAIAKVKEAILELVRSPMADLERKLEALCAKPEEKPEAKPEGEAEPAAKTG